MHCTSCAVNIDLDLEDIPGVKESNTNYARQVSEVTFDDTVVTSEDIMSAIAKSGYTATPQKE